MVRRYVAAVLEAFEYTGQHLDEATDLMVPLLGGQSAPVVRKQIEATIGLAHTKNTEGKPLGWSDPRDWQHWLDLQVKGGELKPEEMKPPDYYFTNDFLPTSYRPSENLLER
jgi:NitT/TauT family transport system substrate-binding protein